ncbi:MAG: endolytic transglycosylase MltG [Chitinivibrionales bacterium]|nr:endolytic transglycosylase MltG [Chitinivibrionales bacterium]
MPRFLQLLYQIWFTGLIAIAAVSGYIVYFILWMFRFMQKNMRVLPAAVICAFLTITGISLYYLYPVGPSCGNIEIIIEPGEPLESVAARMQHKGIIKSSMMLRVWMKLTGKDTRVKAGKCMFQKNEGIISASRKLLDARPVELSVTIREGLIIEQTAQAIAEVFHIDTAEFISLCRSDSFISRFSISSGTLEGYLFPDTYRFPENVDAASIISRMLDRFEEVYGSLDFSEEISSQYSMHEIVTMASIVEKEATLPEERPRIAGVFYNRLRLGYPLGADPTVRYLLRKFSGPLRVSELNTKSPYNTRKYPGLPPGPICSPGAGSLQAAVSPSDTRELYFVAKWDGTGAHDFSHTGAEHERKKRRIRRMNEQRKKGKK